MCPGMMSLTISSAPSQAFNLWLIGTKLISIPILGGAYYPIQVFLITALICLFYILAVNTVWRRRKKWSVPSRKYVLGCIGVFGMWVLFYAFHEISRMIPDLFVRPGWKPVHYRIEFLVSLVIRKGLYIYWMLLFVFLTRSLVRDPEQKAKQKRDLFAGFVVLIFWVLLIKTCWDCFTIHVTMGLNYYTQDLVEGFALLFLSFWIRGRPTTDKKQRQLLNRVAWIHSGIAIGLILMIGATWIAYVSPDRVYLTARGEFPVYLNYVMYPQELGLYGILMGTYLCLMLRLDHRIARTEGPRGLFDRLVLSDQERRLVSVLAEELRPDEEMRLMGVSKDEYEQLLNQVFHKYGLGSRKQVVQLSRRELKKELKT